jgi:hypothetical protein
LHYNPRNVIRRYRLRFLLQEFDLPGSAVDLGRGQECQVTLEDPLVSRRHAQIRVRADGSAEVEDLGSRNGVRINGKRIDGTAALSHGDRIRLGTQELVFVCGDASQREARMTGFLTLCQQCAKPYPEQADACPHCGAAPEREDNTLTGVALEPRQTFTFQLLGQVIERALASGRVAEADRIMGRVAHELEGRIAQGDRLDQGQLGTVSGYATTLALQEGKDTWLRWMFEVHQRLGVLPSAATVEALEAMPAELCGPVVDGFTRWVREQATRGPAGDPAVLRRLDRLAANITR